MSAKMMLAVVKSLEVQTVDDETLINLATSLEAIISCDNFDRVTQEEAFTKLGEIQDVMGKRAALVAQMQQDAEAEEKAEESRKKKKSNGKVKKDVETDESCGHSESDELARLMIRSEEDGTLSFEFRGIRWDWNHNKNSWDMTPKGS